jgi:hypothetical protein
MGALAWINESKYFARAFAWSAIRPYGTTWWFQRGGESPSKLLNRGGFTAHMETPKAIQYGQIRL